MTDQAWVITDGKPGMQNQCVGLAEAVGLPFAIKKIVVRAPWKWLLPPLWPAPLRALSRQGDPLSPPWPRLVIGTGRMSVAPIAAIGAQSGGRTFTVQIQNPGMRRDAFGLIVAPEHDEMSGANVISTLGALHRVTPARLRAEAQQFAPALAHLPRPLVAVLVGGNNRSYRLDAAVAERLADGLAALCRDHGAGLAVTASRRTGDGAFEVLRQHLSRLPAVLWDGSGPNPYFGYLGLADAIVVTCDSVSMASEAASTGKPVYVFDLPGHSAKFDAFHAGLRHAGVSRRFTGTLDTWSYVPPDDTARVAAEVRRRLELPPYSQQERARPRV